MEHHILVGRLRSIYLIALLAPLAFAQSFLSQLKPCPQACEQDTTPISWTYYHDVNRLSVCPETILFDFNLKNPLDDPNTDVTLRACTTGNADTDVNALALSSETTSIKPRDAPTCEETVESSVSAQYSLSGTASSTESDNAVTILNDIQAYLSNPVHCDQTVILGYASGVIVGIYSGKRVGNKAVADNLIQQVVEEAETNKIGSRTTLQVCGDGRSGPDVFGMIIDTTGDFVGVQEVLSSWSDSNCINTDEADTTAVWEDTSFWSVPQPVVNNKTRSIRSLQARADCTAIKVESGNGCGELAERCGISAADFTKYNPDDDLCSTLSVGQLVCCSSGSLPDIRPQPNEDGTCATYTIQAEEYCSLIAANNGLTNDDLEDFNDKVTWGWSGCSNVQAGLVICVSEGNPPLPNPISDAECGPIVPGTTLPEGNYNLTELNPCPLNVCCSKWGHCGTTAEFCDVIKSDTGNPGTTGCISNCETDIQNNDEGPSSFMKVGYFEGWNMNRSCLHMDVRRIDSSFTHIHFAFAEVTDDFEVTIGEKTKPQWEAFKDMDTSAKKILAFGGWSFSTKADSYPIFRNAVTDANRQTFANSVVQFAKDNNLDGLDFDWEYPGAPDIPGVPPGDKGDGDRYQEFLELVRDGLPDDKTLSIAAPASYWYLKGFPIKDMAPVLDYIIYMTYDIHGQWDAENTWASDGCPQGSCLRSHVNYTETYNSLAMITKAGVPSNKVVVGVSSYGRSFKMAEAGCSGPNCLFLGGPTDPQAKQGSCTKEPGYLANAEIQEIVDYYANVKSWYDEENDSDYVVYSDTEWVAYMSDTTKERRIGAYKDFNFAGTSDWAVDLNEFLANDGDSEAPEEDEWDETVPYCTETYDSLEDIEKNADSIPDNCGSLYVLPILRNIASDSLKRYNDIIDDGYDKKFAAYAESVAVSARIAVLDYTDKYGNDYFECQVVEAVSCQRICEDKDGEGSDKCRWSTIEQCDAIDGPYISDYGPLAYKNTSQPCPPDYSMRGILDHDEQTIYFTLPEENKESFYTDILNKTGIDEEYIKWVDSRAPEYTPEKECDPAYTEDIDESCYYKGWWFNVPNAKGYDAEDVTNPKEVVGKSLEKLKNLDREIDIAIAKIKLGQWDRPDELVDALSIPVLMVRQAVDSMEEVAKIGEEILDAQRKDLILFFVSAILFIVPVIGEGLAAAGLVSLGRIIAILGETGGVIEGIYDIANDPESAPLAIFGIVLGVAGIRDAAQVGKAAKFRNDFKAKDSMLGDVIKGDLDKISKVVKNVCSK
ncbi:glycoside hydrolase [Xylaria curta]|nr:glycoside hydrolase [Xylaria curta]